MDSFLEERTHKLNDKKIINGWSFYDWANSVYSLVITSTIFPIYFTASTRSFFNGDQIQFFGSTIENSVLYSYALSASFLIIALILPLLSGIADNSGKKIQFMKFFTYLGSISCAGLYFFDGSNVEYGIILTILAGIGYSGGLVFYDAYLPEIVTEDRIDKVSARGYSFGYAGSVILLILNLAMISYPEWFFMEKDTDFPVRISFLMVGIWWAGFAQISFNRLPENPYNRKVTKQVLASGYKEIRKVFRSLKHLPYMKKFLLSFFLYNMGVQTTMYLAATFGEKELKFDGDFLILTVLIIQLVAIIGAIFFAHLATKKGNKFSLVLMLFMWIGICFAAYNTYTKTHFIFVAFFVGFVMGGIQSLSRATFAKMIPEKTIDHAGYFSFYDVTFNISIVIGTFGWGFVEQFTQNMRNSVIWLTILFILGLITLVTIPLSKGFKVSEVPED
ncbi:MFS transporter [Marinigracilibium pacificum]|uniref:MFS transporter n=1 Tax=Marinigracilibium pacificum TaxID=2729599 RepID=A0A848J4R2_9BACT|nr:MFS transporter [Marinigracilibium pacificum]NMM50706.1 MFS transporter [Marinigracilibium pacificum]